jgi:hypothetical protein
VAAIVGAVAGALCLALALAVNPDLSLEMDRNLPRVTSGFYPAEIVGDESFAWIGRSALLRLPDADRRAPWICAVRVRGGRSAPLEQPVVELAADGIALGSLTATNEYQTLEVTVPPQATRSGLVLTITSSTTFVPGPGDKRELGVQVDQLACRRAARGIVIPPRRALTAATVSGGAFGAAFGLIVMTMPGAIAGAVALAIAQAVPLAAGPAPYSPYADKPAPLALWIALVVVLATILIGRWRGQPLPGPARFVLAFSGAALFLELLALLHPSKLVIDALFHAHRLEWVLHGRYYFTQPMPDGVQFPYAIGLYLFAAPWSVFTEDHVSLLRIVVCTAHAFAGALVYLMVARAWSDRLAGATAVVLFHLVPLPYVVIGNANLTYAFGQSAAFVTLAAAAMWALQMRYPAQLAALFLLAALAFLSHVGVFPVLMTTLVAIAILYRARGGAALGPPARGVFIATVAAAVFSVVTYYGQFGEAYKSLDRVRGRSTATAEPTPGTTTTDATPAPARIPLHVRARTAGMLAARAFGWPVVLLAVAGVWQVWTTGARDRLTLVLIGLAVTYLIFVGFAAATPVEPRFQKYSDEFINRVNYATIPLVVILAGRAVSHGWRAGVVPRLAVAALMAVAAVTGVQHWISWLR